MPANSLPEWVKPGTQMILNDYPRTIVAIEKVHKTGRFTLAGQEGRWKSSGRGDIAKKAGDTWGSSLARLATPDRLTERENILTARAMRPIIEAEIKRLEAILSGSRRDEDPLLIIIAEAERIKAREA
jgi:hypothetical protein